MRKIRISAALFLACLCVWAAVGGSVAGTVKDTNGMALRGVRVIVISTAQGIQTKTTTDAKGSYRFPILPVGNYDLKTEMEGFKPQTRRLALHVDDKVHIDLTLENQ